MHRDVMRKETLLRELRFYPRIGPALGHIHETGALDLDHEPTREKLNRLVPRVCGMTRVNYLRGTIGKTRFENHLSFSRVSITRTETHGFLSRQTYSLAQSR
jgi:hypothetical protein